MRLLWMSTLCGLVSTAAVAESDNVVSVVYEPLAFAPGEYAMFTPQDSRFADINGDGHLDVYIIKQSRVYQRLNLGGMTFGEERLAGLSTRSIDMDGDGDLDRASGVERSANDSARFDLVWLEFDSESGEHMPSAVRELPPMRTASGALFGGVAYAGINVVDLDGDRVGDALRYGYDPELDVSVVEYLLYDVGSDSYRVVARWETAGEFESGGVSAGPDFDGDGLASLVILEFELEEGIHYGYWERVYRVREGEVGPLLAESRPVSSDRNRATTHVMFSPGERAGETFAIHTRNPGRESPSLHVIGSVERLSAAPDGSIGRESLGDLRLDNPLSASASIGGAAPDGVAVMSHRVFDFDGDGRLDVIVDTERNAEYTFLRHRSIVFFGGVDGFEGDFNQRYRFWHPRTGSFDSSDGAFVDFDNDGEPEYVTAGNTSGRVYEFGMVPRADLSINGEVEARDILLLVAKWGMPGDFDDGFGEDVLDSDDLSQLLASWGATTE